LAGLHTLVVSADQDKSKNESADQDLAKNEQRLNYRSNTTHSKMFNISRRSFIKIKGQLVARGLIEIVEINGRNCIRSCFKPAKDEKYLRLYLGDIQKLSSANDQLIFSALRDKAAYAHRVAEENKVEPPEEVKVSFNWLAALTGVGLDADGNVCGRTIYRALTSITNLIDVNIMVWGDKPETLGVVKRGRAAFRIR